MENYFTYPQIMKGMQSWMLLVLELQQQEKQQEKLLTDGQMHRIVTMVCMMILKNLFQEQGYDQNKLTQTDVM